jgi:hypothetical protein
MSVGKMNNILAALTLIIFLMGCAASADGNSKLEMRPGEASFEQLFNQGIGQAWIGGNPPWVQGEEIATLAANSAKSNAVSSVNSEYYQTAIGASLSEHITAPEKFDMAGNIPTTVSINGQTQAIPYSQYHNCAACAGDNLLWIRDASSWTQYVQAPQGTGLSLIAIPSTSGSGYIYEIYPDGQLIKRSVSFYPYNQMTFYADVPGQHILLFAIDNRVSNAIVIDVMGYEASKQPSFQPPNWPPGHNPLTY